MVLRINDAGLDDLAEYTRQWMFDTLKELRMENFSHRFERGLASGELILSNLAIKEFAPPLIKYRPHSNSLLYVTTVGGDAEIHADWLINSNVLAALGIPLHGTATGRIKGFRSSVAVNVVNSVELVVHQCVARFGEFDLRLTGSLAAEILHWFRNVIGRIMQARVEQAYCKIISEKLLTWLKTQLLKVPHRIQMNLGEDFQWIQSLHAIRPAENFIDLQMKNQFFSNGLLMEAVSAMPPETSSSVMYHEIPHTPHVLEVFMDEALLQEMLSTAHFSGELVTNISSPFLRTDCDLLCLGKIVPELRHSLGKSALYAEVFTNEPPVVKLVTNRALIYLNVTFGLYQKIDEVLNVLDVYNDAVVGAKAVKHPNQEPVVQIEIAGEAIVQASLTEKNLDVNLNLHRSRGQLISSKIVGISQKTVDLILSMSVPFLENAAAMLLGNGVNLHQVIDVPSQNESLYFETGFVHFLADMNVRNLL
ncbi:unnamed protein product [Bursaphelenchus xylophilus]|uniref:(pine wood nematode) hypothetical protein n=1 Tax=Bursaphelenchus xylophilus TaxID=6326 RepID=A0A1I7S0I9_BURXY|nr:unnamed protein product [Bursaphelenchus xylophilus]CAG9132276.1 unnamed protein product [Bursaphelenchus xylophilus]